MLGKGARSKGRFKRGQVGGRRGSQQGLGLGGAFMSRCPLRHVMAYAQCTCVHDVIMAFLVT